MCPLRDRSLQETEAHSEPEPAPARCCRCRESGEWSSCGPRGRFTPGNSFQRDELQAEGVFALGNHRQRDGSSIRSAMHVLRLQPGAQPGVVNLGLAAPEARVQPTLNPQMIQLQFDNRSFFRKIPPDISWSYVESGNAEADGMSFDYHPEYLLVPCWMQCLQGLVWGRDPLAHRSCAGEFNLKPAGCEDNCGKRGKTLPGP